MTRSDLLNLRDKETKDYNARIKVIDALLSLVDESGNMPGVVVSMISSLAAHPPTVPPTPSPQAFSTSVLDDAIVAYFERHTRESEWTSASVRDGLEASGYQLPGASREAAMNAIGLSLGRLVESGRIMRVYEGRGRNPHRYRRVLTAEEAFGSPAKVGMSGVKSQEATEVASQTV